MSESKSRLENSCILLRTLCTCKLVNIPVRIISCKQDLNISYRAWRVGGPTYALISARSTKAISAIKLKNLYDLQHVKSCVSNEIYRGNGYWINYLARLWGEWCFHQVGKCFCCDVFYIGVMPISDQDIVLFVIRLVTKSPCFIL